MTKHFLPDVMILGATSDVGQAVAHVFAAQGHDICLVARKSGRLDACCSDLHIRYGVEAKSYEFDVLSSPAEFSGFLDALPVLPEIVVCVVGLLGHQESDARDHYWASRIMRTNFEGPAILLAEIANRFEDLKKGTIVGVSSVAGDRGRATNYIYGSAKAGFSAYLSGLRNRLSKHNVQVITVKPGFIETKMTEHMDLPGRLTAQPQEVAQAIYKAWRGRRDIIYVRKIWCVIMLVIRLIPEKIFKKLSL